MRMHLSCILDLFHLRENWKLLCLNHLCDHAKAHHTGTWQHQYCYIFQHGSPKHILSFGISLQDIDRVNSQRQKCNEC